MKHCANPGCPAQSDDGTTVEYQDSVLHCGHCAALLQPGPAPEPPAVEWTDLVRVRAFSEPHSAFAAQSALRAEGIESFLANAHLAGLAWPYGVVAGGVQLQVRAEDAERARAILSVFGDLAAEAASLSSEPLSAACPRCGVAGPTPVRRRGWWASLLGLLGAPPPAVASVGLRCRACGLEYQD